MHNAARALRVIVAAVIVLLGLTTASAVAQDPKATVLQAEGQVSSNRGSLKTGDPVDFNQIVQTGSDGFAIVRIAWQANNGPCHSDSAFGFGASFRPELPPAACVSSTRTGSAITQTRFDVGKPDGPGERDNRIPTLDPNPAATAEFDALRLGMRPLEPDRNRVARDIVEIKDVPSAGACSVRCARNPRCRSMTYLVDARSCWLKDSAGEVQSAPGAISSTRR